MGSVIISHSYFFQFTRLVKLYETHILDFWEVISHQQVGLHLQDSSSIQHILTILSKLWAIFNFSVNTSDDFVGSCTVGVCCYFYDFLSIVNTNNCLKQSWFLQCNQNTCNSYVRRLAVLRIEVQCIDCNIDIKLVSGIINVTVNYISLLVFFILWLCAFS